MIVEAEQVEQQGLALVGEAQAVVIRDEAGYQAAGGMLQKIKAYLKRVAEVCDPVVAAALTAHRTALAQKQKLEAPAKEAEGILKRAMLTFQQQVERARQAAQRQAEALAEEARLAVAMEAEAKGDAEGITEALTAPVLLPPPVMPVVPKAAGISVRKTWKAEVTDFHALVQAVAEGKAQIETLQPNQMVLNALACSLKGALNLPGVKAVSEQGVAARA